MTTTVHLDLAHLGRGRGLQRPDLQITPAISDVCAVNPHIHLDLQRSRLAATLTDAARELPQQMAWLALASLNIGQVGSHPNPQPVLWSDVIDGMFLTQDTNSGARTLRHHTNEALRLLAAVLVRRHLHNKSEGRHRVWPARTTTA